MGYGKPSRTEELLGEMVGGPNGRIVVDSLGLIHWCQPRNGSDSRPWTNSHLTHVLARTLRTVDGPTWPELYKLSARLGAKPFNLFPHQLDEGMLTPGFAATGPGGLWGWKFQTWRYGNDPRDRWRATVAMAHLHPDPETGENRVERRNLRDTTPAEVLTWAARIGILGNLRVRFANGTRIQSGEVGRKPLEVQL